MTMASGILASTASYTAALVNLAGTKITVTSAPVAATASVTEPKTGILTPSSNSTDWPPLPGVTPPTILVPDFSISWVCLRPSEPVIPWTMTRLVSVRKIAISGPLGCELSGAAGRAVHRVHLFEAGQGRVGEDLSTKFGVVAVQPDDERPGHGLAARGQQRERL